MHDLAVIGAGWAGYSAAIKAKKLGLKVCLIENSFLGGTCLNHGCIPTKTLIQSAKVYSLIKKGPDFGIDSSEPKFDFAKVQQRKATVIDTLRRGMQQGLDGIDFITGRASFISREEIECNGRNIQAKAFIVASGSQPLEIPQFKFDGRKIISSNEALELQDIPKSILIIGGGVIGCEFASLFHNSGSLVTVAELMPQLLPGMDFEIARKLETIFKKKKIVVKAGCDAAALDLSEFDFILVCAGRIPATTGLNLEAIGVKLEKGRILTDEFLRTSIPSIFAAGDCTGKMMLAHYASYQGEIAALNAADPAAMQKADNTVIPACVFSDPEIACVGLNDEVAKGAGRKISVRKFDFLSSGMARVIGETEGFIKVTCEADSGRILGASIIGPRATELISVLGLAISNNLTADQVSKTVFAHPSLAESFGEIF